MFISSGTCDISSKDATDAYGFLMIEANRSRISHVSTGSVSMGSG